jgi:hypothetical protein
VTQIRDGQTWQWPYLTLGATLASIIRWTTGYSETDSFGAPELVTAEEGRLACEHAVEQLFALVRCERDRPVGPECEHHATPPTFPLPFAL